MEVANSHANQATEHGTYLDTVLSRHNVSLHTEQSRFFLCGCMEGETFHCGRAVAVLQVGRSPRKPDDMKALADKIDRSHGWLLRIVPIAVLLGTCTLTVFAQSRGRLSVVVRNASGATVARVTVILTNQVTSG